MGKLGHDPASDFEAIALKLSRLQAALRNGLSRERCLRLWSEFIRERDGHQCVDCRSRRRLSAHHISRKSLFVETQFDTGNGITLCRGCHQAMHQGFNGRPNLLLPVDAQGGEKLSQMERLFSILTDDAVERHLMRDEFYFLSDKLLATFKEMQGFDPETFFPGSRIEQAYLILAEGELGVRRAIAEASGVSMTDQPLLPGGLYAVVSGENRQMRRAIVVQTYVPRSKPST